MDYPRSGMSFRADLIWIRGFQRPAVIWVMFLKDVTTSSPPDPSWGQEVLMCAEPGVLSSLATGVLCPSSTTALSLLGCMGLHLTSAPLPPRQNTSRIIKAEVRGGSTASYITGIARMENMADTPRLIGFRRLSQKLSPVPSNRTFHDKENVLYLFFPRGSHKPRVAIERLKSGEHN